MRYSVRLKWAFGSFTKNPLYIFIGLQFVLIAFVALFIRTWIKPDAEVSFKFDSAYTLIAAAGVAVFFAICRWMLNKIPELRKKYSLYLPYIIYIVLQLMLIIFLPAPVEGGDAWRVRSIAMQISDGDFRAFKPMAYLSQYPNNTGLALFYALFFLFLPKSYFVIKALNLLFNLLTMAFVMKLFRLAFPGRERYLPAFRYYMVFFLPAIFLVNYTYGDVPSTFFITAAVYYGLNYAKTKRLAQCIASAGLFAAAFFIRQTALLAAGAIAVYWLYVFFFRHKSKRLKTLLVTAALALLLLFQLSAVDFIFRQFKCWDTPVHQNCQPVTRWFNIGIPDDERYGYWDKGETTEQYYKVKGDKAKLDQLLLKDIGDTLAKTAPEKLLAGYIVKNYWLWSEGTFESLKYGLCATPSGEWRYDTGSQLFNAALTFLDFTNSCMKGHYIFVLFLSGAYFLTRQGDERGAKLVFSLLILCFYIFYTFWEMKSRYLYPLYPFLLLTSFEMLVRLHERHEAGRIKLKTEN